MRMWFDFGSWIRKNDEIAEELARSLFRARRLDRTVRVLAERIEEGAGEGRRLFVFAGANIPYRRRRQGGR